MQKTFFYSDILVDHDLRFTKAFYSGQPFILKLKSNPSADLNISQKFRLVKTVEEKKTNDLLKSVQVSTHSILNGATLTFLSNEITSRFKAWNKGMMFDLYYRPASINTVDQVFSASHNFRYDFLASRLDGVGGIKYGSPLFGPVRIWKTLNFSWNTQDSNKLLSYSCNLQVENDYQIGVSLDHNLSKMLTLQAQLCYKTPLTLNEYFVKGDILGKIISLGGTYLMMPGMLQSLELNYDLENKLQGIYGYPLALNIAGTHDLAPHTLLKTKFNLAKEIGFDFSWIQIFDKNLRFVFSHKANITNLIHEPARTHFDFGAMIEFTL